MTNNGTCHSCERIALRDAGDAAFWDNIFRSHYWDVVHSYNTSLPGWLVIIARRHIEAIDELTEEEAIELGLLIRNLSLALKSVTDCAKTYVVQFAEAAEHPHVHFHVVPRMTDQPANRRGRKIFRCLAVPEEQQVSEEAMNRMAEQIRPYLI
jgi:diadenosine tetraphosphate (Ap4A) HIT family hydrolase